MALPTGTCLVVGHEREEGALLVGAGWAWLFAKHGLALREQQLVCCRNCRHAILAAGTSCDVDVCVLSCLFLLVFACQ